LKPTEDFLDDYVQDCVDAAHTSWAKGSALHFPLRALWKYPCESLSTWEPASATKYSKKKVHEGPYLLLPNPPLILGDRVVFTDGAAMVPGGEPFDPWIPATIHCVHAATGERLWRRRYGDGEGIELNALVAGALIVHSWWHDKAALRALSLIDGAERWARTGSHLTSGLLAVGEDIVGALVQQEDTEESPASLTRINGADGAIRWTTLLPAHAVEIACDDQAIYSSEMDSGDAIVRIASYQLADGTLRWSKDIDLAAEPLTQKFWQMSKVPGFGRPRVARLAVTAGRLYVCFHSAVACLDAGTGSLLWIFAERLGGLFTTVLMDDAVCTTWDPSPGNHSYCRIHSQTGELLLKKELPPKEISYGPSACGANDVIILGRQELCAISATTGEPVWESDVGLAPYDSFAFPRIAGGKVYVTRAGDCCLYCFG
jgi:outer membrane protein assembly factor BamB